MLFKINDTTGTNENIIKKSIQFHLNGTFFFLSPTDIQNLAPGPPNPKAREESHLKTEEDSLGRAKTQKGNPSRSGRVREWARVKEMTIQRYQIQSLFNNWESMANEVGTVNQKFFVWRSVRVYHLRVPSLHQQQLSLFIRTTLKILGTSR